MCGICGELRFDGQKASAAALDRMSAALAPRGPDGAGFFVNESKGFAHRRLKIIDLSDRANQPMIDQELGLGIVYNGAIYNYPELRKELTALGYTFFSTGDTEVLIKAYHRWGLDFVKRLYGMFAFAIFDLKTGHTVLARDRQGIKPLYYSEISGGFRFASSLTALLAAGQVDTSIDPVALHHYMTFHSVVPPPRTIIRGVRKLPPATLMTIEPDGHVTEQRYWELSFQRSPEEEPLLRRLAGGDAYFFAHIGRPTSGSRCAGWCSSVRRVGLEPGGRASGRGRPERSGDLFDRF